MGASTTVTPARVRDVLPGWGVTQERVDEAVRNIVTAYNPLRVVAFGSWARGEAGPDSDLDLGVFLDEDSKVKPGASLYEAVHERSMSVDILSFDVARHERLKRSRNSVHWYIEHEGRVLYEREELDPMSKELLAAAEDDRAMLQFPSPDRNFGFSAQQTIEKLLKVLIAARGSTFEWTHDLTSLLDQLATLGEQVPLPRPLAVELQPYGVLSRYGGAAELKQPRQEIVSAVETLRAFVLQRVHDLAPKP